MLVHLNALGIDVSDKNNQGFGKIKYSKAKLHALDDEALLEVARKSIDRFLGTKKAPEEYEALRELISLPSMSTLFFAGYGKPDVVFTDFTRGVYKIRDLMGCLTVSLPDNCTVRWQDVWDQLSNKFGSIMDLYRYLEKSIPLKSPQARKVFEFYCRSTILAGRLELPALLPELNLHYDMMTLKQRDGVKALESQRCDFYLRIGQKEILLEVDGIQHYANLNGTANRNGYAAQCQWDRARILLGYEIYRFGTAEFDGPNSEKMVSEFFNSLALRHGVESII